MTVSLSIVVPMFDEADRLDRGLAPILDHLSARHAGAEVLLVDDGSRDATVARANALLALHPRLRGRLLALERNYGKGAAVRAGMLAATGVVRGFVDADNAPPIEELDRLLPLVRSPRQIVIGSRGLDAALLEQRQPWWRERMGRGFNFLLRAGLGIPHRDTQCGFKLFGLEAAELCFTRQTIDGFAFDLEVLWVAGMEGLDVVEVPVRWRHVSQSRVHAVRDSIRMALDAWRIRRRHGSLRLARTAAPHPRRAA